MEIVVTNKRHGSPYDRGAADAYYGRPCVPHYYVGDTYTSTRLEAVDMSPREVTEYLVGYESVVFNEKYSHDHD